MGSRFDEPGRIIVVCSSCGDGLVVLDYYQIGSEGGSRKFAGPPCPEKVLAKYDIRLGPGETRAPCPVCPGAEVSLVPRAVDVMSNSEFEEKYLLLNGDRKGRIMLIPRTSPDYGKVGPEMPSIHLDAPSSVMQPGEEAETAGDGFIDPGLA